MHRRADRGSGSLPDVFNTDQGLRFTDAAFTSALVGHGITISMDGKGAWRDMLEGGVQAVQADEDVFVSPIEQKARRSVVVIRGMLSLIELRYLSGQNGVRSYPTDRQHHARAGPGQQTTDAGAAPR